MRPYLHDPSGKAKGAAGADARSRRAGAALFAVGLCLGILAAERLYLAIQEADAPAPVPRRAVAARKSLEVAAAASAAGGGGGWSLFGRRRRAAANSRHPRASPEFEASTAAAAAKYPELLATLERVAPGREVVIAISNMNLARGGAASALGMWADCMRRSGATAWLVVAIDAELRDHLTEQGIAVYHRPVEIPKAQAGTGDNHAISATKYEILEEFLALGWDVLLSDVDVVAVRDPLSALVRDSDVEGMTDGFDDATAYGEIYGVDDPGMGWSRYAQGHRHMVLNSGLFWLAANERTLALVRRVAAHLKREQIWDQSAWNVEIFTLSHGAYVSPQVTVRVMEWDVYVNSKALFTRIRKLPRRKQKTPVMVHINYHPDKAERMAAVIKHYLHGDAHALDPFPGGSEPGT